MERRRRRPATRLHVLSHADAQGGHTRLALRWMGRDAGRRHSVVVTSPTRETPRPLLDAVTAGGGRELSVLDPAGDLLDGTDGLLERARRLADGVAATRRLTSTRTTRCRRSPSAGCAAPAVSAAT